MPDAASNGIRLHYTSHGKGTPVVFIAGLSYGEFTWSWVAPQLASRHLVVTFDNRGVDQSDKPPGPYTTQLMADDALGLMNALDLPPCTLVGHSLGGFIAQRVALAQPDRVAKLCLIATSFGGPNSLPPTAAALAALVDRSGGDRAVAERALKVNAAPGFADRFPDRAAQFFRYRDPVGMTPAAYQAQYHAGVTHNSEAELSQLSMPVVIVHGEHDQVVPPGNAELLKARMPRARVRVRIVEGAGHMVPMERPEELAEVIATLAAL